MGQAASKRQTRAPSVTGSPALLYAWDSSTHVLPALGLVWHLLLPSCLICC
jgi:hypothetical protein